jgi:hypothetical protein
LPMRRARRPIQFKSPRTSAASSHPSSSPIACSIVCMSSARVRCGPAGALVGISGVTVGAVTGTVRVAGAGLGFGGFGGVGTP